MQEPVAPLLANGFIALFERPYQVSDRIKINSNYRLWSLWRKPPWGTEFKLKAYPMDAGDEFLYKTDLTKRAKLVFARHNLPYPRISSYWPE